MLTALSLFCTSGTGIYGSLISGMTGEHNILYAKSVLDLFNPDYAGQLVLDQLFRAVFLTVYVRKLIFVYLFGEFILSLRLAPVTRRCSHSAKAVKREHEVWPAKKNTLK